MMRILELILFFAIPIIGLADTAAGQTTETDWTKIDLGAADLACQSNDADNFLSLFIESAAVRAAYTADQLYVITNNPEGRLEGHVAGADYTDFPLAVVDYYYVTTIGPARDGYAHIKWETNLSADNRLRMDWVSVFYDGQSEGGDDPGNEIGTGNDPGTLLFHPTETCWELVQIEVTIPAGP
jgi:hypothetical protein